MLNLKSSCVAVILAGGQGSRIGGNKAMQLLHGRPLILRVLDCLSPQIERILISIGPKATSPSLETAIRSALLADAARPTPIPAQNDYEFLSDPSHGEFLGPLAGIATAIAWCQAQNHASRPEFLLTVTVDTVFLPDNLLTVMNASEETREETREEMNAEKPIIRARSMGRIHPAIALWPLAAKIPHSQQNLAEYIGSVEQAARENGGRAPSLQQFQTQFACAVVDFPPRPHPIAALRDRFFNINNLADLQLAEQAFIGDK